MIIKSFKNGIFLRDVREDDDKIIGDFFDSLDGETRALFNRRDYNRRGILKFIRKPDGSRRYFIAEKDGVMAGYVFFLNYDTSIPELGIALRSEWRGKGLGADMVEFAQELIKSEGRGGILLTTHTANVRAQSLYEKMGFVCMGLCKNGSELFYLWRFLQK